MKKLSILIALCTPMWVQAQTIDQVLQSIEQNNKELQSQVQLFKAQKMETKAFYQEQKAKRNPDVRKMVQEQEYQKQMAEAKARQEAAQKRIDEAKINK